MTLPSWLWHALLRAARSGEKRKMGGGREGSKCCMYLHFSPSPPAARSALHLGPVLAATQHSLSSRVTAAQSKPLSGGSAGAHAGTPPSPLPSPSLPLRSSPAAILRSVRRAWEAAAARACPHRGGGRVTGSGAAVAGFLFPSSVLVVKIK